MAFQVGKDSSGIFLNIKTTVLRCVHRFVRKKFVFKNWFEVLAVVHSDWICYSCILSCFNKGNRRPKQRWLGVYGIGLTGGGSAKSEIGVCAGFRFFLFSWLKKMNSQVLMRIHESESNDNLHGYHFPFLWTLCKFHPKNRLAVACNPLRW